MSRDILLHILDLARWAPSGDNTQPWRFEIVSDDHVAVHGFDTREHVLYDFDGHPSQMAHGALLETLRIAATAYQLEASWILRPGCPDTAPIYDVALRARDNLPPDPLLPFIEQRVVQRRPMRTTPLSDIQRQRLAASVGPEFTLQFFETWRERLAVAKLLWQNAYIRLTCPEAFPVHRDIIEWGAQFSTDRIPEKAVGVDPLTARLMKWVMHSWERVDFFNRYLFGTIVPRIQLDFIPSLGCAAHILMRRTTPPSGLLDYVASGIALQRLWLTATSLGLHLQPQMTPVIFRWYARAGQNFSMHPATSKQALFLAERFEALASTDADCSFSFFCRVGSSCLPRSRSIRMPLRDLFYKTKRP